MIRLLLAEDQTMLREALAALLDLEPDIEVVAQAARGDEIADAAWSSRADVAVVDIEMPGMSGLDAAVLVRERVPSCRVLIVTTFARPGLLRRAMESGASGFVLKGAPLTELAGAIRAVATGSTAFDLDLAATALRDGGSPLTAREVEVLQAVRVTPTVAEIADQLYLSRGTVRNHLSSAIRKLGATNRVHAMQIAEAKGWI